MQLSLPLNGPLNQRSPTELRSTTMDLSQRRKCDGPVGNTIADGAVHPQVQLVRRKFRVAMTPPITAIAPEITNEATSVYAGFASQIVVARPREAKMA